MTWFAKRTCSEGSLDLTGHAATVGELEWRERLEVVHKQMQEAMTELITNKNYSEAERLLHVVEKRMLDLIEDMGGSVIRSGLWT
jgi:hypothetical protein